MPESYECKLCPNYAFCSWFRGEETMRSAPCPYEVVNSNAKTEKDEHAPTRLVTRHG